MSASETRKICVRFISYKLKSSVLYIPFKLFIFINFVFSMYQCILETF